MTGVEFNPDAAAIARTRLDEVRVAHLERDSLDFAEGQFDCVICVDILEHLRQPEVLLAMIRRWLSDTGTLVISLPNVRNYTVIRSLLAGNWTYVSAGLLDADHVRFFTRRELEKLLFRSGFDVDDLRMVPGEGFSEWVSQGRPLEIVQGGFQVRAASTEEASEFFAYQYLVRAVTQVARQGRENLPQASPLKADEPTDSSTLSISLCGTGGSFEPPVSSSGTGFQNVALPVPRQDSRTTGSGPPWTQHFVASDWSSA